MIAGRILEALPALLFAALYAAHAERQAWPWTVSDASADWSVKFVGFAPDGRSLEIEQQHFSRENDRLRHSVDIRRRIVARSWHAPGRVVSPNGRILARSEESGRLHVWDAASHQHLYTLPGGDVLSIVFAPGRMLTFSPDSRLLARGGGSIAEIRDARSGQLLHTLRVGGQVFDLAFAPDGKTLACGSGSELQLWDMQSGRRLKSAATANSVFAIAFSPDGLQIAALADEVGVLEIHDARTLRLVKSMTAQDMSYSIDYSPDGRFIACGSYNELVRIWDTRSGKLWKVLRGHRDGVEAVKFSPDGRLLASQSLDGSVKIRRLY